MNPTDLFTGLADFQGYADGLLADTTYEQLAPSIRKVTMAMIPVITQGVYDALAAYDETPAPEPAAEPAPEPSAEPESEPAAEPTSEPAQEEEPQADLSDGQQLLKTAVATGALLEYQIFASTKRNGTDASLYKYQHEEIQDHHREAHWTAMDRLLDWLDANPTVGGWKESAEYQRRQALPVRSGTEFDQYYGIGASAFFYHKVLFLVRQVWGHDVQPLLPAEPSDKMMETAKEALCYKVIAHAVMQFDVTELPRSIRYDYNHEYTKGSQMQDRDRLYNQLLARYSSFVASIERMKAVAAGSTVVDGSHNNEDNKYYGVL